MMTRVYVVHPFKGQGRPGEREANKAKIAAICRDLTAHGYLPISPVHALSWLDDEVPEQRELALALCKELTLSADEVRVFGDWEGSEGCAQEIQFAFERGIPLIGLYTLEGRY